MGSAQEAEAVAASMVVTATTATNEPAIADKKKKIRWWVHHCKDAVMQEAEVAATLLQANVLDMKMLAATTTTQPETMKEESKSKDDDGRFSKEEIAEIDKEFEKYMKPSSSLDAWYGGTKEDAAPAKELTFATSMGDDVAAQSHFQQQLSGNWNEQALAAQDKLEPMAVIMNKIALPEQEKIAAMKQLEEEFEKWKQLKEEYYSKQHKPLKEAAHYMQNAAFRLDSSSSDQSKKNKSII